MPHDPARRLALAAASMLLAGCVSVSWDRESRYAPIPGEALSRIAAGADLGAALELFGAPLWVWETAEGGAQGAALAYGWFDERSLGVSVSVPVSDYYSPSIDYDHIDQRMKGLVLFFDEGWKLKSWRTGLLRDLSREARRPPAVLEEDA